MFKRLLSIVPLPCQFDALHGFFVGLIQSLSCLGIEKRLFTFRLFFGTKSLTDCYIIKNYL